jgi:hypothetical protein
MEVQVYSGVFLILSGRQYDHQGSQVEQLGTVRGEHIINISTQEGRRKRCWW